MLDGASFLRFQGDIDRGPLGDELVQPESEKRPLRLRIRHTSACQQSLLNGGATRLLSFARQVSQGFAFSLHRGGGAPHENPSFRFLGQPEALFDPFRQRILG